MQPSVLGITNRLGSWGSGIAPNEKRVILFKLALLHNDDLVRDHPHSDCLAAVREALGDIEDAGQTGLSVVAEYMKRMWADGAQYLLHMLSAHGLVPNDVDICFVFGIPGVWSESSIVRMKEAIHQSGMLLFKGVPAPMGLTLEPEAAAMAINPGLIKNGLLKACVLTYVPSPSAERSSSLPGPHHACDFISYELASLTPFTVKECVPGEGGLYGDMFMKRALRSFLKQQVESTVGTNIASVDWANCEAAVEKVWATVCAQKAEQMCDTSWSPPLEVCRLDGTLLSSVTLYGADIVPVLRSITDGILELTHAQVNAVGAKKEGQTPDRIIVVGGFGCNKFLKT
ncbi:hypothetical protein C8A01DRAFT_35555 [Parachaetomium inaequale]|uniref:Uncharacterized protein n=1 Tax=Parachaetomium inaequale TaxID=2588326 RepID=A0AAN6PGP6_9PEZI|nr:hypothetical protein C8A01DRAFT_35555 [Parachaetomium inaequale]